MSDAQQLRSVVRQVRPLYKTLEAATLAGLHGTWIGVTQRAILEQLHDNGPMTVPAIGRSLVAPRQFIQKTMNGLLALDMVEKQANAAHKRSVLFVLTPTGTALVAKVLAREDEVTRQISADLSPDDIAAAGRVMAAMIRGYGADKS